MGLGSDGDDGGVGSICIYFSLPQPPCGSNPAKKNNDGGGGATLYMGMCLLLLFFNLFVCRFGYQFMLCCLLVRNE